MFRGKDVQDIQELKRQGFSLRAISGLTGYDRRTVRRYLAAGSGTPVYGPRTPAESKLDPFKPYLQERMQAGVWSAQVLLRELRQKRYSGGYTILKDWLRRAWNAHHLAGASGIDWLTHFRGVVVARLGHRG